MPTRNDNVLSWASELESEAADQAARTSRLPFLAGHLALMPDAHWGWKGDFILTASNYTQQ